MSIGLRLEELREKSVYKKKEVAEKLGMPYTTYNNYETDAVNQVLILFAKFHNYTLCP